MFDPSFSLPALSAEQDDKTDEDLFPVPVPHTQVTEDAEVQWQKDIVADNRHDVPRSLLHRSKAIMDELQKETVAGVLDDYSQCARLPWRRQRATSEMDYRAHIITTRGEVFTMTLIEVYRLATNFVRRQYKLSPDARLDLFVDPKTDGYAVRWDKPKVLEQLRALMTPMQNM